MTALQAALLGVVQGLTEFLPISSSAHLILARAVFGWDAGEYELAFDVACHLGTLLSIVLFFRRDVVSMILSAPTAVGGDGDSHRLVRSVVVGTIPIVIVGALFADVITASLRSELVVPFTLAGGAVVMLLAERVGRLSRSEAELSLGEAFGLGVAQAVALVPGVSRSGAVLTIGMLIGLRRERAARFSFVLGMPAILAAGAKAGLELYGTGLPPGAFWVCTVGFVSSAVVGYITVTYFIRYVARHSLSAFAGYRLLLAVGIGAWLFGS